MKLKTKHLFKVLAISNKVGFTKELKVLLTGFDVKNLSKKEIEDKQRDITGDLLISVLEGLDKVEVEVYELIADIAGKKAEEIEDQSINETFGQLKEIFTNKELTDFLSQAVA